MTDGEKMVWASVYANVYTSFQYQHRHAAVAAEHAWSAVEDLREIAEDAASEDGSTKEKYECRRWRCADKGLISPMFKVENENNYFDNLLWKHNDNKV